MDFVPKQQTELISNEASDLQILPISTRVFKNLKNNPRKNDEPTILSVGEVGIPIKWKERLTHPVIVTRFNKTQLMKKLRDGHIVSFSSCTGKSKGDKIQITSDNIRLVELNIGDICNRWLENGDYVTLNTQPSNHKISIRELKVVLIDSSNIQLKPLYTPTFNADFD